MRLGAAAAGGGKSIQFVEEDDGRRHLPGLLEDLADSPLALADPLREELGAFDGHEVRPALARNRLCDQGLSGPRRAVEKDTLRGLDTQVLELLPPGERVLDRLADILLCLLKPADIPPGGVRHLEEDLPHGARAHVAEGVAEVLALHLHLLEDLRRDLLGLEVDLGEITPERLDRRLTGESGEVRPDKSVGLLGDGGDVHAFPKRHTPGVDVEHLDPVVLRRDPDLDLPVEPAGTAEGGVDGVEPVRGPDHHDLPPLLEPVHHRQELGHHTPLDLPGHLLAPGGDRVEFVDEDDGRRMLPGVLEDLAEPLFALAVVLRDHLGSRDRYEVGSALARDRLCDQGLSRPRRAVEEDALRRLDTELPEDLRVAHRKFDRLADTLQLALQAADILVADPLDALKPGGGFFGELDLRVLGDDHGVLRLDHHGLERDELGLHEREPRLDRHGIVLHDRKVNQLVDDAAVVDGELFWEIFGRREHHPFRLNLLVQRLYLYTVPDAGAGVEPGKIIDPDLPLVPVVHHGTPDLGHGATLSFDSDKISGAEPELQHGVGVEPCLARPLILRISAIYLQVYLGHYL